MLKNTDLTTLFGTAWHTNALAIMAAIGAATGAGTPNGVLTPSFTGQEYFDTTNNVFYVAYGTTNTSWAPIAAATIPGTVTGQGGNSSASFGLEGNVNLQVSAAGVQPGATAADNVLAVYSLPANFFDKAGRGINITASGSFGATGNNKRVKIIVNPATAVVGSTVGASGVTICDTGTVATNGGGWQLEGQVFKYGAAASNTQLGVHSQAQIGAAVAAMLAPSLITAVESGAILIAVTGNATTAATDILFNFLQVNATN